MAIRIIDFAVGFQTDQNPTSSIAADTIEVTPSGNLSSDNTQDALEELQGDIDVLDSRADGHDTNISSLQTADVTLGNSIVSLAGVVATKADAAATTSALATKADTTSTTAALATKLDKSAGVAQQLRIDDYIDIDHEASPSAPTAGKLRIYAKADNKVYQQTSAGVESSLGGGGLTPVDVTALPATLVNGIAYQNSQTTFNSTVLPVTALAATIEVTDAKGTCSATNYMAIAPGSGDTLLYKGSPITSSDRFVIRRPNATARFNKAAGSTVWEVTYQTIAVPQGGQIPSSDGSSSIAAGLAGYSKVVNSFSNTSGSTTAGTFTNITGSTIILEEGEWDIDAAQSIYIQGGNGTGSNFRIGLSQLYDITLGAAVQSAYAGMSESSALGSLAQANHHTTVVVPKGGGSKQFCLRVSSVEAASATTITQLLGAHSGSGHIRATRK